MITIISRLYKDQEVVEGGGGGGGEGMLHH